MDPSYLISYMWNGVGMHGDGSMHNFKPMKGGVPSVFTPDHVPLVTNMVREELAKTGVIEPLVTIVFVWRFEEDGGEVTT